MRTQFIVVGVLSIAVAAAIFQLAGVGFLAGQNQAGDLTTDKLQERANESLAGSGEFEGAANTQSDDGLVGTIISGGQFIASLAGFVAVVPSFLSSLGLPSWAAQPLGWTASIIASVGILEFVTGRSYT